VGPSYEEPPAAVIKVPKPMAGSQFVAPKSDKKEPQMVTIRRVMEPSSSEPTVTITLKGDKPGHDKVLFTLVNGQGIFFLLLNARFCKLSNFTRGSFVYE
jgi:hypothetical protein